MLQLTELRVNNLFEVNSPSQSKKIKKISAIRSKEALLGGTWYRLERLIPIRITARILLKSGFVKFGWITESNVFECLYFKCILENDALQIFGNSLNNVKPLKYIHELQNLYFDLTEKELQIDLNEITAFVPDGDPARNQVIAADSEAVNKEETYVLLSSNLD